MRNVKMHQPYMPTLGVLDDCSPAVVNLVQRCTARDPSARPPMYRIVWELNEIFSNPTAYMMSMAANDGPSAVTWADSYPSIPSTPSSATNSPASASSLPYSPLRHPPQHQSYSSFPPQQDGSGYGDAAMFNAFPQHQQQHQHQHHQAPTTYGQASYSSDSNNSPVRVIIPHCVSPLSLASCIIDLALLLFIFHINFGGAVWLSIL